MEKDYKVIIPKGLEKHKYVNTYRIGYSETEIILEFGNTLNQEADGETIVEVASRLAIPPMILFKLIIDLFSAGRDYENEFKVDIGFGMEDQVQDDSLETK